MFSCTTAQHIYCTNCTVCSWTVLTVITQKLMLHVQLHNTPYLLYKYCTNCTFFNWTVLTGITQKLLLHVQLHNSTAHFLYKYCTVCNWTVLTVITQKLLLYVQLHKGTQTFQRLSSVVQCSRLFYILRVSVRNHSVISLDRNFQITGTAPKHIFTCWQHRVTHPTVPLFRI